MRGSGPTTAVMRSFRGLVVVAAVNRRESLHAVKAVQAVVVRTSWLQVIEKRPSVVFTQRLSLENPLTPGQQI
jgi:hypothetical protein